MREEDEKAEFFPVARRRIGMSPLLMDDIRRNTMEGETYELNKYIILMRAAVEFLDKELKMLHEEKVNLNIEQAIKKPY